MSWQQVFVIDKVRLWHLDLMQFSPVSVPPPASSPYSKLAPLVEPYLNFEIHTRLECFYTVHYTFLCTPLRFGKSCWCFEARSRPQIVELSSLNPEFDKVRWASETAIFISWSSIKLVTGGLTARSSQTWFLMCPLIMSSWHTTGTYATLLHVRQKNSSSYYKTCFYATKPNSCHSSQPLHPEISHLFDLTLSNVEHIYWP